MLPVMPQVICFGSRSDADGLSLQTFSPQTEFVDDPAELAPLRCQLIFDADWNFRVHCSAYQSGAFQLSQVERQHSL